MFGRIPKNGEICKKAKTLPDFVKAEIKSVQNCTECYENAFQFPDSSFSMPCTPPHALIWAKAPGWSWWPAKAMSTNDGLIHVRFFCDHTVLNISPASCLLFTELNNYYPGGKICTNAQFKAAIVASLLNYRLLLCKFNQKDTILPVSLQILGGERIYRNVRKKFGKFIYAESRTKLCLQDFSQYSNKMIGVNESHSPGYHSEKMVKRKSTDIIGDIEVQQLQQKRQKVDNSPNTHTPKNTDANEGADNQVQKETGIENEHQLSNKT